MADESRVLVSLDTDRVKSYVFRYGKLTQIIGASAILDKLNRSDTEKIIRKYTGAELIFAGGGSAMAVVPRKHAGAIIKEVEALYASRSASITGVAVSLEGGTFGERVTEAARQLRIKKETKFKPCTIPSSPLLKHCEWCSAPWASALISHQGAEIALCDGCQIKREGMSNEEDAEADSEFVTRDREFLARVRKRGASMLARELKLIADSCAPKGYIGLIYADGNGMGKIIQNLKRPEDYRAFSKGVEKCLKEAVYDALEAGIPSSNRQWPSRIVVLGGDDVILIVPGSRALAVAGAVCDNFAAKVGKEFSGNNLPDLPRKLSLSVGVAISHANYPIALLVELAESLLKSAKKAGAIRRAENPGFNESMIDFHVIQSGASLELSHIRSHELTIGGDRAGAKCALTERPYPMSKFKELLSYASKLKTNKTALPGSKIRYLYDSLFVSKNHAKMSTLMVLGRASKDQRAMLDEFFSRFQVRGDTIPWRINAGSYHTTPLMDLIEAAEVQGGESQDGR